jgi:exodeoxyribonuclease-3
MQPDQLKLDLPGYYQFWCSAEKKGYSGTAIFTRHEPISVSYGVGSAEFDNEGRVIILEYENFYVVTCYTPNARQELVRLPYRMEWDDLFRKKMQELDEEKPVIFCGDFNVAKEEIDLKNPSTNHFNPGFTDEEREKFRALLNAGFTDTFRAQYPDLKGAYSWWSYRANARQNNTGWRIDYVVVSNRFSANCQNASIYPDVFGSDHCPVGLDFEV